MQEKGGQLWRLQRRIIVGSWCEGVQATSWYRLYGHQVLVRWSVACSSVGLSGCICWCKKRIKKLL